MKDLTFRLVSREHPDKDKASLENYTLAKAQSVREFHRSFPMYAPTPLAQLTNTAKKLGIGDIYVKDESHRFGLNAFKVLGGSFAMGNILAGKVT